MPVFRLCVLLFTFFGTVAFSGCNLSSRSPLSQHIVEYRVIYGCDARQLAPLLRQVAPVVVSCHDSLNMVVLSGPAPAVARGLEVIDRLEASSAGTIRTETFALQYANARELAPLLQQMADRGFFYDPAAEVPYPPRGVELRPDAPAFVADDRANTLICRFATAQRTRIRDMIDQLDISGPSRPVKSAPPEPAAPAASQPKDIVECQAVACSDPREMARIVHELFGVATASDNYTDTVIIKGPPEIVAQAARTIQRIEANDNHGMPAAVFFIVHPKRAKAQDVAPLLQSLSNRGFFAADDHHITAPIFAFDERTNAVIIRAHRALEDRVRNIIDELDRPLDR